VQQGPQSFFVYNVREDMGESTDLTSTSQSIASHLRGLLEAWKEDVGTDRDARTQ